MAVVNVDLSEYDAVRNRVKELEEQVKELKKINASLKSNAKVVLRKETVVERPENIQEIGDYGEIFLKRKIRKTREFSESYINFEDVRLKVENEMREEVERSVKDNKDAYEIYTKKYDALEKEYQKKNAKLEESYQKKLLAKEDMIREEYKYTIDKLDKKKNELIQCLNNIGNVATEVILDLNNRFFIPKKSVNKVRQIREIATCKNV